MAVSGNIQSLGEAEGRGSFRWKLVETVTSTMRHKDEVSSSNKEFWIRIAKLMCSKEVLAIWKKMKKRVAQKAIAHIVNGDIPLSDADEDKNLSPLDWLMYDRYLVINCTDSSLKLFEEDITTKQQNTMIMIFHFVQSFHIERLMHRNPAALPQAWWNLCVEYCKCGRRGSVMLLQWRWHMMKLATRSIFYKYWAGGACRQMTVNDHFKPRPIHIAIAKRYPHVVVEDLHTWQQFLATDRIVLPEQLEKLLMTLLPYETEKSGTDEPHGDDDLVLIEPETDTIDLLDDDDEHTLESNLEPFLQVNGDSKNMDLRVRTEVYDYVSSASKEVVIRPIKIEPNLGVMKDCADFSSVEQGLGSIRVENVQSVQVIETNCKVAEAKMAETSIKKEVIYAKCNKEDVSIMEDGSRSKRIEILDMNEDILKIQKNVKGTQEEVVENNVEPANLDKGEVNEEDEEDIIMITEESECTHKFLEINKGVIGSVISVNGDQTQERKMADRPNSVLGSKRVLVGTSKEMTAEESKKENKKLTVTLEKDIQEVEVSREDLIHDHDVECMDLDECREDVEEVLDIDDVTLKSLERQHISMKFDKRQPAGSPSLDNVKEEITILPNDTLLHEDQKFEFDFSEDVKLVSDCVVEIDKLEDMSFFKNKTLNCNTTMNLKDFVHIRKPNVTENKQILIVGTKETNELLVENSAVPVTCHVQKSQSTMSYICERRRIRMRRKRRHYEPDEILSNPDFEPKLLELPSSFYAISDNVRLLKECVPATVDLVADFTLADNDGVVNVVDPDLEATYSTIALISGKIIKLEPVTKKLNKTQKPKLQRPTITNTTHFLDRILNENSQMGEIQKEHAVTTSLNDTLLTIRLSANQKELSDDEKLVPKSKPICQPSISEVRKINQRLNTAQVEPIVPQSSMTVNDDTDTRIGEVLTVEYEPPTTPSLQNTIPAKLVFNKKGVSFISSTQSLKTPLRPAPKPGVSPWYKPKPSKFEANLSMSSLCSMLKSLEPQSEQLDSTEQKKKRYCCSLKRHHVLNDARQRLVYKKWKKKPKFIKVLNIHKHTATECDCCCKGVYSESLAEADMKKIDEDVPNPNCPTTAASKPQDHKLSESEDELHILEDNLANLTDGDRQIDVKGEEENLSTDQPQYLRVLKPSELMPQNPNKSISIDSETQTDIDLTENDGVENLIPNCNVAAGIADRKDQSCNNVIGAAPRNRTRKNMLVQIRKMSRHKQGWKKRAANVIHVSDESDESRSAIAPSTSGEQEAALVSVGPIANPVLKISCVLADAEPNSSVSSSIPKEPVFQQPPDAEILITDVKSAEELTSSVTSLFEDKFKPIMPNETMIPVLVLPDHLLPLVQSHPESLRPNVPKVDDMIKSRKTPEETSATSSNKSVQHAQGNVMLLDLIDKLGLQSNDPLHTSSSLEGNDLPNSEFKSYIVCDQMNVPKQCVVINKNSNKVLHTITLPDDKTWDIKELQKMIYVPDYVTINKGDDLKLVDSESLKSTTLNENVNLGGNGQNNDVIVIDNDEEDGTNAVNVLNGNNYAGVIDVSVLYDTNEHQPVNVLTETDTNSIQDTAILELLPKPRPQVDMSHGELFKLTSLMHNDQGVESNEINEMENQATKVTKLVPQRGNSILLDLVDQLGINSEIVASFNTNPTTENECLVGGHNQDVIQLEQPVPTAKTIVSNTNTVSAVKDKPTELEGLLSSGGKEKFFSAKTRSVIWNFQAAKQQGDKQKQIRYVPLPSAKSKVRILKSKGVLKNDKFKVQTLNAKSLLRNDKLNVKRVAENTFTIVGEETEEVNRVVSGKKSLLPTMGNANSFVVNKKIRVQRAQVRGKPVDDDFVVKPGLQYSRTNAGRHLRSRVKIDLRESSDEDDVPLIDLNSDVLNSTSLKSREKQVTDALNMIREAKNHTQRILNVSNSPANRRLGVLGDLQPSTSYIKRNKLLKNTEAVIDLDQDNSPDTPEYLEEEYLDDVIDLDEAPDDVQNRNNSTVESQEDGKEDSELILGI